MSYSRRCIENVNPVLWPLRSPDLTLLKFSFPYLKQLVYPDVVTIQTDLAACLHVVCTSLNTTLLRCGLSTIPRHAEPCFDVNSGYFDIWLYKYLQILQFMCSIRSLLRLCRHTLFFVFFLINYGSYRQGSIENVDRDGIVSALVHPRIGYPSPRLRNRKILENALQGNSPNFRNLPTALLEAITLGTYEKMNYCTLPHRNSVVNHLNRCVIYSDESVW
ncbi:hypothetical protein TNCV_4653551 [Trichonephila clavipes]|nr:hypothetical protein TNCV_4653551 [Trichonephila clavipes]